LNPQNLPYISNEYNVVEFLEFVKGSFSIEHYLKYDDVKAHCENGDETSAWEHYKHHGINEGRELHELGSRTNLIPHLSNIKASILEIGPFLRPCVVGKHVKYFEVLDTAGLKERAVQFKFPAVHIPHIDFVHPSGDMSIINEAFDFAISSHCIEHQPDLIKHLNAVESVLESGGKYQVLCPDKRLCFDYFNPETRLIDVIAAHKTGRTVHTLKSVLEHRSRVTHNTAIDHWHENHGAPVSGQTKLDAVTRALEEFENSNGGYVDVHAWIFTPINFLFIMQELKAMNFINLELESMYPPVYGSNEFIAVFRKP